MNSSVKILLFFLFFSTSLVDYSYTSLQFLPIHSYIHSTTIPILVTCRFFFFSLQLSKVQFFPCFYAYNTKKIKTVRDNIKYLLLLEFSYNTIHRKKSSEINI